MLEEGWGTFRDSFSWSLPPPQRCLGAVAEAMGSEEGTEAGGCLHCAVPGVASGQPMPQMDT